MKKKHIPSTAITIRTYSDLNQFACRFATGSFNLLAVVGTAGLSKSKTFEGVMRKVDHCLVKGNVTAFMLYKTLFDNRNKLIIIDDADTLYEDKKCQPLLKCLCDTEQQKTIPGHGRQQPCRGKPHCREIVWLVTGAWTPLIAATSTIPQQLWVVSSHVATKKNCYILIRASWRLRPFPSWRLR